jgi:hypothetical protein
VYRCIFPRLIGEDCESVDLSVSDELGFKMSAIAFDGKCGIIRYIISEIYYHNVIKALTDNLLMLFLVHTLFSQA